LTSHASSAFTNWSMELVHMHAYTLSVTSQGMTTLNEYSYSAASA
jgi:hypothetical protein